MTAASYVRMNLPVGQQNVAQAVDADKWVRGTCRLCGVGCRLEMGVKDGRPVALRGVPKARTNYGYLCMKGMLFYKIMQHPDRLIKP